MQRRKKNTQLASPLNQLKLSVLMPLIRYQLLRSQKNNLGWPLVANLIEIFGELWVTKRKQLNVTSDCLLLLSPSVRFAS